MARQPIQQAFEFREHGGKRKGAGRPRKPGRPCEPHGKRPSLRARWPVHAILRIERHVGNLRTRNKYHAVRRALQTTHKRTDFRVVHISVQSTHVHLVVEAANEAALGRGLQGFQIAAAKQLNATAQRKGRVFADRYHARILQSPRDVRNVINYVLNNWRHHHEDERLETRYWMVDYFSSGPTFSGWKDPPGKPPPSYEPLATKPPETWLLAVGWKHWGDLATYAVPGRDCYEG